MDHTHFKANQTAAGYVADGLDEITLEAFELHMMGCPECVEDVEAWRAIRAEMHERQPGRAAARRLRMPVLTDWRMAASLLGAGVVGAAGGWIGKTAQVTDLDSARTVVFNMSAVTRGAECTTLRFATDTQAAVLRVPGVSRGMRVVALDSDKHELSSAHYVARIQADGSQLLRFDPQVLAGRAVFIEARRPDGTGEPIGCITGETVAPDSDR